ncbi:DUF6502 family protein [Pseudorhodoferax sp.]|uniref:DUF6502 family protein n=1 Tax=Pseudorhodoferax sp. TaxID=1993553 RepID=UPI002DD63378|nr:DUF6502 family protein [Pseudorhodoferax sp.]
MLRLFKPAARLLLQNGVSYGAFAAALKRVFLEAAQDELKARGMTRTDSAITLLSGVHRRDVRTLLRSAPEVSAGAQANSPTSKANEVALHWLSQRPWLDSRSQPRVLTRGTHADSFDALVAAVSSDVRPRAVLDELKRLGVVEESDNEVRLLARNFVPHQGFEEMSVLFADNVCDHLATASRNLQGETNLLEQAVHVDEITRASADELHRAALDIWAQAFRDYFNRADQRFKHDAANATAEQRDHRARFGVYFFIDKDNES